MSPTLCLCMIVKNESKIITRLFDSVISIIDSYCICDTGSTDNTIEIIKNYFDKKNIIGKIITEPFINFAHNRNFALNACTGISDYILLLDADMILIINNFDKNILNTANKFSILQGTDKFYYQNTRILKNDGLSKYVGVTHEYIESPHNNILIPKNNLFINDVGDGGSKINKFERDILLLKQGIIDEPLNNRYYFYLANSYFDSKVYDKAIETYLIRIKLGGWKEEVWYSYYRLGIIYMRLNNMAQAIYYWLEGYNYYPNRLEGLYEILKYYRENSKYNLIKYLYPIIKNELDKNENRDNYLFLHNDVYTHKIYYEYSIFAYYLGIKNINNELVKVLNCNDNEYTNLIKNMKYYKDILQPIKVIDFSNYFITTFNNQDIKFVSSSSCLIKNLNNDGYKLNIRYVNYYINENGNCIHPGNHAITINELKNLDNNFNIIDSYIENIDDYHKYYIIGIEDIRIYYDTNNILKFIGTGNTANNQIRIFTGDYCLDNNLQSNIHSNLHSNKLSPILLTQTFKKTLYEKNWVFVNYKSKTRIIYNWFPITICDVDENNNLNIIGTSSFFPKKKDEITLEEKLCFSSNETKNMPNIFQNIRGSTCGYTYNKEIWFITHLVSYEKPREYYHMICVFDENMNLLRYTAPFKFEGISIEYCLSIIVENDRIIINYSTWDKTTKIAIYDNNYIESKLIYTP
jgi:glycosyltransferase involved in cell wall biosynthesis